MLSFMPKSAELGLLITLYPDLNIACIKSLVIWIDSYIDFAKNCVTRVIELSVSFYIHVTPIKLRT
jgi:hypothetical protein